LKGESAIQQKRIEQLTSQLQAEVERSKRFEQTELQQQQLIDKVNQLKLLRETNDALKQEAEDNARQTAFWKEKVREIVI
jgi:hypothetical protein